jgi:intracellular sulfur oxidation DsrE/DsrF family protein
LARSPQPPLALLFYGSGVRLSVKNDESAKALKSLQAKGTKICLCAASVEYLDLNYSDLIGEGVHAEEIMKLLQEADKVVTL